MHLCVAVEDPKLNNVRIAGINNVQTSISRSVQNILH